MAVNARAIRKHFFVWLIAGVAIAAFYVFVTSDGLYREAPNRRLIVFFALIGACAWIGAATAEAAAALPDPERSSSFNIPAILKSLPLGVALIAGAVAASTALNGAGFGALAAAPLLLLVIYAGGRVRRAAA